MSAQAAAQLGARERGVRRICRKHLKFSQRVHSGMVHVNDTTLADEPHVPFGGVQDSGLGREGGMASIEEMMEVKWVTFQLGKRKFLF
jgi:aldehyde dehydrogenase (NAD+)